MPLYKSQKQQLKQAIQSQLADLKEQLAMASDEERLFSRLLIKPECIYCVTCQQNKE